MSLLREIGGSGVAGPAGSVSLLREIGGSGVAGFLRKKVVIEHCF